MKKRMNRMKSGAADRCGFTLIELLIVVIILGVLASIIIPQFSNAGVEARESMLRENLRNLRTQINVYRAQHNDISPGYPNGDPTQVPTADLFIEQMTSETDEYADAHAASTPYGPYLRNIPENPINNLKTIEILANGVALPLDGDNSHGWIFRPDDVVFLSDTDEADSSNESYFTY